MIPWIPNVRVAPSGEGLEIIAEPETSPLEGRMMWDANLSRTSLQKTLTDGQVGYAFEPEEQPHGLLVKGLSSAPTQGKRCTPLFPLKAPKGHCTVGEISVCGEKRTKTVYLGIRNMGTYTVSTELSATIKKLIGASIEVGVSAEVSAENFHRHEWQNCDVYICSGTTWVYSHTNRYTRICSVLKNFTPAWGWLPTGFTKPPVEDCPQWDVSPL